MFNCYRLHLSPKLGIELDPKTEKYIDDNSPLKIWSKDYDIEYNTLDFLSNELLNIDLFDIELEII